MARKSKARPKSPQEIAADKLAARKLDLEAVNIQPDSAALPSSEAIEVTRAGQKRGDQTVKEDNARRLDAFAALKEGMAQGAYDAMRRLERDMLIRRGEGDRGPMGIRVDCQDSDFARAMKIVEAGERVDAVYSHISLRDRWLCEELICPAIDRGTWRDHVDYITQESHPHGQGAVVRALAVNVRDAYVAIERKVAA